MNEAHRRVLSAAAYIFLLSCALFAQKPVLEFYGTESDVSDKESIKLTQDLFFTQLHELDAFTIVDNRSEFFDAKTANKSVFVFFAEIFETTEGWQIVLNISDPQLNKKMTYTKTYDSYYKILVEAKSTLASLLAMVQEAHRTTVPPPVTQPQAEKTVSLESLAGTWKGEPYIDKIMILKGSRGFIIYKNGAAMNISLSIQGTSVYAVQTSKANASFYPELPREEALTIAQTAPPIEWRFSLNSDGTILSGEKKSLSKTTAVTWTKQ